MSEEVRTVPDAAAERTRRRFARRQWARRWGAWRWGVTSALAVGLLVGAFWLVFVSSVLAADEVTVTGTSYLSAGQVRDAAEVPLGTPLARVDIGLVERRVEALPAVADVTVTRSWPHAVDIVVTERTPVAVLTVDGTIMGMDAEGVLFREYTRAPDDLPDIRTTGATDRRVRQEAASVVAALPGAVARQVDHLEVSSIDQITLALRDGRSVLWGSADQSATKAKVLEVLLRRPGQVYDVSVPAQPTIR